MRTILSLYAFLGFHTSCWCLPLSTRSSAASLIGDNVIVLGVVALVGIGSLIGACAFCFRRKRKFEKFENEGNSPENTKKNEYPIFRALATEANDSAAIVPCSRNNLSRDNLLNSSDNLTEEGVVLSINDDINAVSIVDSSEIILIDKSSVVGRSSPLANREKSLPSPHSTIVYETERHIVAEQQQLQKKIQSPLLSKSSSSTPLLYANNAQSYQHSQPVLEQLQQQTPTSKLLAHKDITKETSFKDFYTDNEPQILEDGTKSFSVIDMTEETVKDDSANTNPFLNSISLSTVIDDGSQLDISIDTTNEVATLEKIQENVEETSDLMVEDVKSEVNELIIAERKSSVASNESQNDNNSIEEALRALDNAIGMTDDEDEFEENTSKSKTLDNLNLEEIHEEATLLVDSIVNDCEKLLEELNDKEPSTPAPTSSDNFEFDNFSTDLVDRYTQSTPCAPNKHKTISPVEAGYQASKALFPEGLDISNINNETFPVSSPRNDETFNLIEQSPPRELPAIKIDKDKDEVSSEDLTTVTPVNTPIELNYSSETWDKMTTATGAISKQGATFVSEDNTNNTITLETDAITFNNDGWYLHPQAKNETYEVDGTEDDGEFSNNLEDMDSTYDMLRRQLTEMLPHAQGMNNHNDFLDDDVEASNNKDSASPSENYGIKYGDVDEATNGVPFEGIGAFLGMNQDTLHETNEVTINYKPRALSPIMEESECDETCRTFVFNNDTKLMDSTSTGVMESASAEAVMGVTKTLMASNDTLFNFEDTLSDRDDLLLSPRYTAMTANSSNSSTLSRRDESIYSDKTPTNDDPQQVTEIFNRSNQELDEILKNNIRQHPLNLELGGTGIPTLTKYEKLAFSDEWPLEIPEHIINDLASPEQPKTADSLSLEQDVTFTIDDQKTCVSLNLKNDDDERISEISEPLFASETCGEELENDDDERNKDYDNSLQNDDIMSIEADDNYNFEMNDENGNQENSQTKDHSTTSEHTLNVQDDVASGGGDGTTYFDNDSINPPNVKATNGIEIEKDSLEPEGSKISDTFEIDSIQTSPSRNDSMAIDDVSSMKAVQIDTTNANSSAVINQMESEEVEVVVMESDKKKKEKDKKKSNVVTETLTTSTTITPTAGEEATIRNLHQTTSKLTSFNDFLMHELFNNVTDDVNGATVSCSMFNRNHYNHSLILNGEEDPWGSADIRSSCNPDMISTSFTNEWSDDEDSDNSSEEFMYVKGALENNNSGNGVYTIAEDIKEDEDEVETAESHEKCEDIVDEEVCEIANEKVMEEAAADVKENVVAWTQHQDKVPITPIGSHGEEHQIVNESDDDVSEGEFVPSSWDQSLQPTRSSLKSPDKSTEQKKRNVAFKVQRYHSVYEYPCEVVQLSPAYSEPQLWSNYLDDCSGSIDYFTYAHQLSELTGDFAQQMEGFAVTSSTRPFHSSNLSPQCNTWPNEANDFSWSQIQEITDAEEVPLVTDETPKIDWPLRKIPAALCYDDEEDRPDSGVGESADIITDSPPSLGELCHVKGSLRLPLEMVSNTSSEVSEIAKESEVSIQITNDDDNAKPRELDEDEGSDKLIDAQFNNNILPTPSCTGSMDSLSSSSVSSSDRPPSFTTFGKANKSSIDENRTAIVFIEDEIATTLIERQKNIKNIEKAIKTEVKADKYLSNKHILSVGSTRLSDSTDEDSGFENLRLAKTNDIEFNFKT